MPEWFSRLPGWLVPVVTTIVLAWFTGYWTYRFERRRSRFQKLVDYYADFVGFASGDLGRARSADAGLTRKPASAADTDGQNVWRKGWARLERQRHANRRELENLRFRIQMFEADPGLRESVQWLSENAASFYPDASLEDYARREKIIGTYQDRLNELTSQVRRRYNRAWWPPSRARSTPPTARSTSSSTSSTG
jgi:hypothetical protein